MKRTGFIVILVVVALLGSVLGYRLARPSSTSPVAAEVAAKLDPILAVSSKVEKATFPLTVTDDMGRTVTISRVPQRIVSIAPNATELLFALGLGDKVVGRTDWDDYPPQANSIDIVTSYYTGTDPEKILEKHPDLVITDGYAAIGDTLDTLGVKMIVIQAKDIPGVLQNIALVSRVTGAESAAGAMIADMQARTQKVVKRVPAEGRPYVFFEIDGTDPSKPWTAGPGSFIDSLITLAGGQNIVRDARPWAEVNLESILMAQPDMIVLGDTPYVTPAVVKARAGAWQQLNAVKNNKVFAISDPALTSRPGPRLIDGLEELVNILHPQES